MSEALRLLQREVEQALKRLQRATQPSTAEAQARALEEFAKKMRAESADHPTISAHAYGLRLAADKADTEAKRIREEAK